jgi:MFS family permease
VKSAIRAGDSVRVHGVKPRGAYLIAAVSIEKAGGAVVIDDGPDGKDTDSNEKPPGAQRAAMEASGIVRLTLFAPKGQVCGALLHDGTILRLGHKEARRQSDRLQPGSQVSVRGEGLVNEQGRVIEVREIGKPDGTFEPIKKPKHEDAKATEPDAAQAIAEENAGASHGDAPRCSKTEMTMNNRFALDWVNFLLANVKDGLGPFLAVYLLASQHWDAGKIGIVMMIAGVATVIARIPLGAFVDWTHWKRGLIVVASAAVALGALAISLVPTLIPVAIAQVAIGIADAAFPPAIAAISLGVVGPMAFTRRVGRNEAFTHAGTASTAVAAGVAGWLITPSAVLWFIAALALASIWATLRIDAGAIDHALARGAVSGHEEQHSDWRSLLQSKPLLAFTAAISLFHFANAAMLPLLGEKLALDNQGTATLFMAACITTAQIAMVPMAILVGRKADAWGRKPIFLAGFAVLPLRGVLYTLAQAPYALVSIQILDGIGAGIFGALFYIVVADLTKGTGRYNLAQGAAAAAWGLGAALSNSVAGVIVDLAGYNAAFLFLAAVALAAFILFWIAVPETGEQSKSIEPEVNGPRMPVQSILVGLRAPAE